MTSDIWVRISVFKKKPPVFNCKIEGSDTEAQWCCQQHYVRHWRQGSTNS